VVLGLVYLMTTKPPLGASILALAVFVVLGAATGLPHWRGAARGK
jgi:hypothetical protein